MRADPWRQFTGAAIAALGLLLWSPGLHNTQAQSPPAAASTSVEQSLAEVTPLPIYSIFPPAALENLDQQTRRQLWRVPGQKKWPLEPNGHPKVETERVDRLHHVVDGESVRRIRNMWRLSGRELRRLNPDVDFENLEDGQKLLVWKRNPRRYGVSYSGASSRWGRLIHGEPLPTDENYEILFHHRTFGTYYAVSETQRVLNALYEQYPDTHKLIIGDISFRNGRKIYPHKSHRTGRDIDISYPRNDGPPPNLERFHYVRRDELDVEKTLLMVKEFVESGYVEYIFMDRWFQRMLRREAKEQGAPEAWLDKVFEYPRWGGDAIVKHESGHRNHMHVRFYCQPTDRRCR